MRSVRLGGAVLAIGLCTGTLISAVGPGISAGASSATLSASPHRRLADGQAITVTAAGYPTNADLDLVECDQTLGCDLSSVQVFPSGSTGGFTTMYFVNRMLNLAGTAVDCAAANTCVLVSIDISDLSTGAETPIRFDPNLPLAPPISISISLNATGGVAPKSGVAELSGNLTCNRGADVYLYVQLSQTVNRQIFDGYGNGEVLCTQAGTQPWQMTVSPTSHFFGTGAASAYVNAQAYAGGQYSNDSVQGTVILERIALPKLVPGNPSVAEPPAGQTTVLRFPVHLSAPSTVPVTFQYATLNGTASSPEDFVLTSGFVTIPAGDVRTTIPITVNGDTDTTGDQIFVVSLTNATNATIGGYYGLGTVTITDP